MDNEPNQQVENIINNSENIVNWDENIVNWDENIINMVEGGVISYNMWELDNSDIPISPIINTSNPKYTLMKKKFKIKAIKEPYYTHKIKITYKKKNFIKLLGKKVALS